MKITRRSFLGILGAAIVAAAIPVVPDIAQIEQTKYRVYTMHVTMEEIDGEMKITSSWGPPTEESNRIAIHTAEKSEWWVHK